jgi:metallo-beta-lactamase family protein
MKIRFIGPLGKVTGSCTWMHDEANDWNFLVDCGMQQGERTAEGWNACDWPFDPAEIKFVILTHAHIDHSGLIPMLYRKGFRGLVYCSRETAEIAKILLPDAAELSDIGFTAKDVDAIRWHEPRRSPFFGQFHPIDRNLFLRFFRSGHVIGALSVAVHWGAPGPGQRSIAFSGDLGPNVEDHEGLPFLRHRMYAGSNDFAVIESTYGGTVRTAEQIDPEHRRAQLRSLLERTIARSGSLIIPAFALGRVQDVLFDLHWIVAENPERYRDVGFHIDAPSARKMNAVVLEALRRTENNGKNGKVRPLWLGKQMFRWFGLDDKDPVHVRTVLDICHMTLGAEAGEDVQLPACGNAVARAWRPLFRAITNRRQHVPNEDSRASVYVVSSGTCDGGPAAWWLPKLIPSTSNTVALAGFCSASTVGGQLLSLAKAGLEERRRLTGSLDWPGGMTMPLAGIGADVVALTGYSAHADQTGLLDWVLNHHKDELRLVGKAVFIQHGGDLQREALAEAMKARVEMEGTTVQAMVPADPDLWFDLDKDASEISDETCLREMEDEVARLSREIARRRGMPGRSSGGASVGGLQG